MSFKKIMARILVCAILQLGVMSGAPISPEEIEKVMNIMHRTKIEYIVKQDDPPLPS